MLSMNQELPSIQAEHSVMGRFTPASSGWELLSLLLLAQWELGVKNAIFYREEGAIV